MDRKIQLSLKPMDNSEDKQPSETNKDEYQTNMEIVSDNVAKARNGTNVPDIPNIDIENPADIIHDMFSGKIKPAEIMKL